MSRYSDRIRKVSDIKSEIVPVPEWKDEEGVPVFEIRSMSGDERADMYSKYIDDEGNFDPQMLYPALIVHTCFVPVPDDLPGGYKQLDPDAEKAFDVEDVAWLGEKNAAALEKLANVSMRLSGIGAAAKDEAGKGSSSPSTPATTPSDASTSS